MNDPTPTPTDSEREAEIKLLMDEAVLSRAIAEEIVSMHEDCGEEEG